MGKCEEMIIVWSSVIVVQEVLGWCTRGGPGIGNLCVGEGYVGSNRLLICFLEFIRPRLVEVEGCWCC